ncbi:MAG: SH3 domain-containing protein [Muribaculaceae bacterium]|nr:SH3 domain-containing protein [Muribaculaceae bacterium]
MSSVLTFKASKSSKDLDTLAAILSRSDANISKYWGILVSVSVIIECLKNEDPDFIKLIKESCCPDIISKAQEYNDSGENLDMKVAATGFAQRILDLDDSEIFEFYNLLVKNDKNGSLNYFSLKYKEIEKNIEENKRKEEEQQRQKDEEAERQRKENEEAERRRKQREEEERIRQEREEADRLWKQQEAAEWLRRQEEAERQRKLKVEAERKATKRKVRNFWFFMILLFAGIYWFWLKDYLNERKLPHGNVFAENLILRSSKDSEDENNVICLLPYGTDVLIMEDSNDGWYKVKADGKQGYVAGKYLLSPDRFKLLDNVWDDEEIRKLVSESIFRLGILDFVESQAPQVLEDSVSNWKIENRPYYSYNNVSFPDLKNGYDSIQDFAFIIKNPYLGQRKVIIYSFDNQGSPILMDVEQADDFGVIRDVTFDKRSKKYKIKYLK